MDCRRLNGDNLNSARLGEGGIVQLTAHYELRCGMLYPQTLCADSALLCFLGMGENLLRF
jgi:hypothetical protein